MNDNIEMMALVGRPGFEDAKRMVFTLFEWCTFKGLCWYTRQYAFAGDPASLHTLFAAAMHMPYPGNVWACAIFEVVRRLLGKA